ncbi:MAG: peptidylprolyl isomerase [Chthoniobacterales bacterium]|nr:peptidylprolyl isomerase [Chthoniobacterales bacterium]
MWMKKNSFFVGFFGHVFHVFERILSPSLLVIVVFFWGARVAASQVASETGIGPEVADFYVLFPGEKKPRKFVIALYDGVAPQTVANFKELVRRGFYRHHLFHRAIPDILVQTGDPLSRRRAARTGTGGPGYTLPGEIRLPLQRGCVAMGRLDDAINPAYRSNGSQFFVALCDLPELNGKYTVFGKVIEGMDVLSKISQARTDTNDFPVQNYRIVRTELVKRVLGAVSGAVGEGARAKAR